MKKTGLFFGLLLAVQVAALGQVQVNVTPDALQYKNPIFSGDYPDPSLLRVGEDYYITFSSFDYYPGLPIWHSKDLINWTPVGHAITKNVGSVWAPDLVQHKGKFYIYFPANKSNWVVWSDSIEGPWSEPIDLKVGMIDPGHVVDADGKRWLYLSHGHYVGLSDDGLSVVGEVHKAYDGWAFPRAWTVECTSLEGPKLMKHGAYYYLTNAQGGTAGPATSHMVVSARSKSLFGPWENSPYNPIVKTLDKSEKWWSKGHGTPFEDKEGKWWMVFHAYENGFYQMGRQTLLQPLEWTADGWFKTPEAIEADLPMMRPHGASSAGEFNLSDDFSGGDLGFQWQFYKDCSPDRYELKDGGLVLKALGNTVGESFPLLCQPPHHSYEAQVDVEAGADAVGGLTLFYNETGFVATGVDLKTVRYANKGWMRPIETFETTKKVTLRILNREGTVDFFYRLEGQEWRKTDRSCLVSSFNHNAFGGFLSLRLGLFASGEGSVRFSNFTYRAIP